MYFCPAFSNKCCCSSVVEHFLGKEEVTSSSLVNSSKSKRGYDDATRNGGICYLRQQPLCLHKKVVAVNNG